MTEYRIIIGSPSGPDFDFRTESIILSSISGASAVDVVGTELSIDVFSVSVEHYPGELLFSPADYDGIFTKDGYFFGTEYSGGDLREVPYGTPLVFYKDGSVFGKFYVKNIVRKGPNLYKINAMSAIGFLENQKHYGGIYSNKTVEQMLEDIIGDEFNYSVDVAIKDEVVSGWLPISTKRANLHLLMFAMGISITKDANGDVAFGYLEYSEPTSVVSGKVFYGGDVDYNVPATAAEVVEYSFYKLQSTEEEQLFTNLGDTTAESLLIEFKYPCYDLRTEDQLTIDSYGDNYAIVTGNGVLYGKAYTQNTRTIRREIADATGAANIATSSQDALVNALNSENVLRRILSYYSSKKTVSIAINSSGEKCGDVISFYDPFMESESGFISQMEIYASSFIKASLEVITDYTPTGQGNFYHNRALISANGIWTVPEGVTDIRIALIGGGGGGRGGYDGEIGAGGIAQPDWGIEGDLTRYDDEDEGFTSAYYENQPTAQGGAGGEPGIPGKTYVIDKTVTPGEVISVTVGAGGGGGARNGGVGSAGTATTASSTSLGTISSANGTATEAGYFDVLGGESYAAGGVAGYAGMPGGQTDAQSLAGWWGYAGLPGSDFNETWHGGAGGAGVIDHITETWPDGGLRGSGGGGGGAAYGANGGAGGDGYLHESESRSTDVYGGDGGAGANAAPPPQAPYGCAGQGGNGGGGGGSAGSGFQYYSSRYSPFGGHFGTGARGPAGQGSVGGQGGAGCVIIYW